jgi:hypothetical protein
MRPPPFTRATAASSPWSRIHLRASRIACVMALRRIPLGIAVKDIRRNPGQRSQFGHERSAWTPPSTLPIAPYRARSSNQLGSLLQRVTVGFAPIS